MKVLLLAQFLPPMLGGEERHVWTLARALGGKGARGDLARLCDGPRRAGRKPSRRVCALSECEPPPLSCPSSTAIRHARMRYRCLIRW